MDLDEVIDEIVRLMQPSNCAGTSYLRRSSLAVLYPVSDFACTDDEGYFVARRLVSSADAGMTSWSMEQFSAAFFDAISRFSEKSSHIKLRSLVDALAAHISDKASNISFNKIRFCANMMSVTAASGSSMTPEQIYTELRVSAAYDLTIEVSHI